MRILRKAERLEINMRHIRTDTDHPTGYVDVFTDSSGQLRYDIHEHVAYDYIVLDKAEVEELADKNFAVFCFGILEQRGKGTRAPLYRILDAILHKWASGATKTKIFCDLNLRRPYVDRDVLLVPLESSDILNLNDAEVTMTWNPLYGAADFPLHTRRFCVKMSKDFNIEIIIITFGERGCSIYHDTRYVEIMGEKVTVVDSVGPEDAFSAAFLHRYFSSKSCPENSSTSRAG